MTEQYLNTSLTPELYCSNTKVSLFFYIKILGFSIQYQREEEGFAMIERQGVRIMLDEITKRSIETGRTWILAPMEIPFGRGINLEIKTTNVDELYSNTMRAGWSQYFFTYRR